MKQRLQIRARQMPLREASDGTGVKQSRQCPQASIIFSKLLNSALKRPFITLELACSDRLFNKAGKESALRISFKFTKPVLPSPISKKLYIR